MTESEPETERSAPSEGVGRVLAIACVVGLGLFGLARPDSVVAGGLAWLAFLLCAISGWGHVVARLANVDEPDFGLRAAWGLAGYLAITGPLVAVGVCSRPVLLVLLGAGVIAFAWRELTTPVPCVRAARHGLRYLREHPGMGLLAILIGLFALLQITGAVAALDRNPWDDDIAYTPMVKRLLDAGDLLEPFSFRRLGAYGGQTVLSALGGARGTLASVHLIDKGLCFAIAMLGIASFARERRAEPLWVVLLLLVLLLLPDISINTAAHWSGVVLFVALYRAVLLEQWGMVGLIGAGTCTLRQNYLLVVVVFVAIALFIRLRAARRTSSWGEAWQKERRIWLTVVVVAVIAIAGWWIAAYVSNGTFLYPLIGGTWNAEIFIKPPDQTWAQDLSFVVWACIETSPILIVPLLFALLATTSDERPSRPMIALFLAVTIGFLILAKSLAGAAEPSHSWRYAFGFAVALTAMFVIETGSRATARIRLADHGRWLLLAALVLQILASRGAAPKRFVATFDDIREALAIGAHGDPSAQVERRRYAAMQAVIPPAAKVAVMLDDAAYLDFGRNRIANLDTPGFASPGRAMPAFSGAEAVREYLVAQGYRYLAFVRQDRSRYFYRRNFWLWRIFNDGEFFQLMSAYQIDQIDSFAELATTTKVLYDTDGLVVLDVSSPLREASVRSADGDEATRRGEWVRELADREGFHDAWSLCSRGDVRFEDGIAGLQFVDAGTDDAAWYEIVRPRTTEPLRGTAIRALFRRAHLRLRGTTPMRLQIKAALSLKTVFTRPRLDVSLDGEILASVIPDAQGRYTIDVTVDRERLEGNWHDLYLVLSSVAEPDKDQRDLRVARLELVEWTPVP